MAMHINQIELAKTLPPRLLRFFARFPPQQLVASPTTVVNGSSPGSTAPQENTNPATTATPGFENPFRNTKHPATGNWHNPVFSLRRQADLVKMARAHGVEGLLPFTTKGTEERIRKREEFGLRVKGTGVGQRVKGKWWERNIRVRLEKRRQAMLDMPQMVQTWKQVNVLPSPFYTGTDEISSLAMVGGGRSTQSRPLLGCRCYLTGIWGFPAVQIAEGFCYA